LAKNLKHSNPYTILVGGLSFFAMVMVKILKRKFPATEERMKHWWFRVWKVLSTFTTLIAVVVAAFAARALTHAGSRNSSSIW